MKNGLQLRMILAVLTLVSSVKGCLSHANENRDFDEERISNFRIAPLVQESIQCSGALQRILRFKHRFSPPDDSESAHLSSKITQLTDSTAPLLWHSVRFLISNRQAWLGRPGDDQILKALLQRSSPQALGQAFAFSIRASSEILRPTLLAIFRERILEIVVANETRAQTWAFLFPHLAATAPLTHLSRISRSDSGQFWLRSTVKSDELRLPAQAFPTFLDDGHSCGACPEMFTGFMKALRLMPNKASDTLVRPVYIIFRGIVIGVIKVGNDTDTSFLSLRTIHDDAERAPLVFGGVYGMKRSFVRDILRQTSKGSQPLRLNVSRLDTRPLSMLLNFPSFSNPELFRSLVRTSGDRFVTNLRRSELDGSDRWHAIYWDAIGARLRARRDEIQKDLLQIKLLQ